MKTTDFYKKLTSAQLQENIEKQFGSKVNLTKYDREQLEDIRNKLRTRIHQQEGTAGINDLLTNETYQKDKAMLELLNTRIKEMLGENIKKLRDKMVELSEAKKSKPDFLDMDKDGDKKEPMKKAIADKKAGTNKAVAKGSLKEFDQGKGSNDNTSFAKKLAIIAARAHLSSGQITDPAHLEKLLGLPGATIQMVNEWQTLTDDEIYDLVDEVANELYDMTNGRAEPDYPNYKGGVAEGSSLSKAIKKSKAGKEAVKETFDDYDDVGTQKKTSSGTATKTATGIKHQGKYGSSYDANDDNADNYSKPSKAAKTSAEKKADKSNDIKLPAWKGNVTKHSMKEAAKPSAGMTAKEKSAVAKKAHAGKDIGKPGKGFEKVEKAAAKGGAKDPKAVAGAAMWKAEAAKKAKAKKAAKNESIESFRRHVGIVNESLGYFLAEDEEGKAKAITAASDIVNDFTSWMQRVGQYQTKSMIELADAIRADFGSEESEKFKQAVGPALAATLEVLTSQREAVSRAVSTLAGEAVPDAAMGADPMAAPMEPGMDVTAPDEMNPEPGAMPAPEDEFGASDAAAGQGSTGREMRESQFARKLSESHSIMTKLSK